MKARQTGLNNGNYLDRDIETDSGRRYISADELVVPESSGTFTDGVELPGRDDGANDEGPDWRSSFVPKSSGMASSLVLDKAGSDCRCFPLMSDVGLLGRTSGTRRLITF